VTNLVDLHLHTTASDGVLSPTALVELAASRELSVIAITDHDSTEGIAEAVILSSPFKAAAKARAMRWTLWTPMPIP